MAPIVHVPTVEELAARGLARADGRGVYKIEPAGQAEIYAAMQHNADEKIADPELRRQEERDAISRGRADA